MDNTGARSAGGDEKRDRGKKLTRAVAIWGALLGIAAVAEAAIRAQPEGLVLSHDTVQRIARDTAMFIGLSCIGLVTLGAYLRKEVKPVKNMAVAVAAGALGAGAAVALAWATGA